MVQYAVYTYDTATRVGHLTDITVRLHPSTAHTVTVTTYTTLTTTEEGNDDYYNGLKTSQAFPHSFQNSTKFVLIDFASNGSKETSCFVNTIYF